MAKLCSDCREKKPDTSVRGTCQAINYIPTGQLPPKHQPWTDSANFSLCDECAEHYNLCAWCWGPLNGHGRVSVPTEKKFCRQFATDDGNHVKGMRVGEQIVAQFYVDMFGGSMWEAKSLSRGVRHVASRIIPEGRMATLELYFDLDKADPEAVIELHEVASRWWASVQNAKTWKITVEVKQ